MKRYNLTELWALLALFLSQIFDQVGGSERYVAAGLFSCEGHAGTWARRPVPCSPDSRSQRHFRADSEQALLHAVYNNGS